jgi:hypothetical protein
MKKVIDITGQRFGRLVVIEKTSIKRNKKFLWKCVCDCGNETYTCSSNLLSGNTKSCGCLQINRTSRIKDLSGQRFGMLVVIEFYKREKKQTIWKVKCDCGVENYISSSNLIRVKSCGCLKKGFRDTNSLVGKKFGMWTVIERSKKPEHIKVDKGFWLCRCECGREGIIRTSALKDGSSTSCGNHKKSSEFIDLTGQIFGNLTVIKRAENVKSSQIIVQWFCRCSCGNNIIIQSATLRNGTVKSCGCLNSLGLTIANGSAALDRLFKDYKTRAKKRGLDFELTKEEFSILTQQDCFYDGTSPSQIKRSIYKGGNYIYNGLDRVDSSKGYTLDNVVPCCKKCNEGKMAISLNEFYDWIERVYNNSAKQRKQVVVL